MGLERESMLLGSKVSLPLVARGTPPNLLVVGADRCPIGIEDFSQSNRMDAGVKVRR